MPAGDVPEPRTTRSIPHEEALSDRLPNLRSAKMTVRSRRVVITGLGVISSIGLSVDEFWTALLAGRSGIRFLSSFDARVLPVRIAGEIPEFHAENHIEKRKSIKVMGRHIQLAVAAASQAVRDARLEEGALNPERLGVSMGTGMLHADLEQLETVVTASLEPSGQVNYHLLGSEGPKLVFPLWLLKYIPNMTASHISIFHNAQGPSNTLTTLCTSSAHALGEAYWIIRRGDADCMIAGGSDARLDPLSLIKYIKLGLLTHENDPPERASRPFDPGATGIVMGEGAAVLILEELDSARSRGAKIYAEFVGYGSGCDAYQLLEPSIPYRGLRIAIENALTDAAIGPESIDWVSASAPSFPAYDRMEINALQAVFGKSTTLPVTAIKSSLGHTHAASGALALTAGVLSIREGCIPPTRNGPYSIPTPALDVVWNLPRRLTADYVLINNSGFGGNSACLILKRYSEATAVDG